MACRAVAATQHLPEGDVEEAQPLLRGMVTAGIAVGGMELLRERGIAMRVPDCMRERSVLRRQQQRDKNEPQECPSHRHGV